MILFLKISSTQLLRIIHFIDHYIWSHEKLLELFEEAQGGIVLGFTKLGNATDDEIEKAEFWALADKAEEPLNSRIENWTYDKFYLKKFKAYLLSELKKAEMGGNREKAA